LWAWGDNGQGQLGDGTTTGRDVPTHIGTATWSRVAAGGTHSAALGTDGTLWAWGDNSQGQLGDGTTTDRPEPTQIGTESTWTAATAGGAHTIAQLNVYRDTGTTG
jgi:hypothetical protein